VLPPGAGRLRAVVGSGELDGLELAVELSPADAAAVLAAEPGALLPADLTARLLEALDEARAGAHDEPLAAEAGQLREEGQGR
jgi:hypothetical protein